MTYFAYMDAFVKLCTMFLVAMLITLSTKVLDSRFRFSSKFSFRSMFGAMIFVLWLFDVYEWYTRQRNALEALLIAVHDHYAWIIISGFFAGLS